MGAVTAGSLVVLTTCATREDADRLAAGLVEERLGACVQVLDITSHYRWEGAVARDPEVLMLVKTSTERYGALEAWLVAQHPYDLPEIVALPVAGGLAGYLSWVAEETAIGG